MSQAVDQARILGGLKDFQRDTVEYVFDQLYGERQAKRFLVADEVGLGKTLVARGVIAKAIAHLQREGVKRIDVVYVCSNADIARQNINRLNVTGREEFNLPTRLTLLPLHLRSIKHRDLNFVSFTPGTTFDLKSRGGVAQERALLFRLVRHVWDTLGLRHRGVYRLLQGGSSYESFRRLVVSTPDRFGDGDGMIDKELAEAFKNELEQVDARRRAAGEPTLRERFVELADRLQHSTKDYWHERAALVGELRTLLAKSCVRALQADLVILDEFQRFRDLLDGESAAAELAGHLFSEKDARVLLLSATPYKMYTLSDEGDEDHFADFVRTARFLIGDDAGVERFEGSLRAYRQALFELDGDSIEQVLERRSDVESQLRQIMVRTERLGVTEDRSGMLVDARTNGLRLEAGDLRAFLTAESVSRRLGAGDSLEYWKSGSYLLNFMDSYKLKRALRGIDEGDVRRTELGGLLQDGSGLLDLQRIEAYQRIDPGNARLRALMTDIVESGAWRLLWMPPSLPYYRLGPPFDDPKVANLTKRLVFSSWTVVPQVIGALVSYEVERLMMRSRSAAFRNDKDAYSKHAPLLRFNRSRSGAIASMSVFGLLYPSPTLARLGDPLSISAELGGGEEPPALADVLAVAESRIREVIAPVLEGRPTDGPVDASWYWAGPLLLDSAADDPWNQAWLSRPKAHEAWSSGDGAERGDGSLWAEHVDEARRMLGDHVTLGRPPDDLASVLARLAVGGPAICALRAFARVSHGSTDFTNGDARDGAARVAWGLRSFFNVPEVMALIRGRGKGTEPYWTKVVDYCVNGGLQAVLSEYAHVLRESLGFLERDAERIVPEMARVINEALSIRAATYSADGIDITNGAMTLEPRAVRLRARFALRFGAQSLEDESELQRAGTVRTAFNSPFWPFVLATTSVGQEGLDFHQYCHAVVHWNLPANPVDLEQREGRVHRYKGHAIRKNLAVVHRSAAFVPGVIDPWEELFQAAVRDRDGSLGDLVPYWIFTRDGGAQIERYVPALPLSREIEKLRQLKRSLAAYRLAFGQPRQEDLIAYLQSRKDIDGIDLGALALDLSPPHREWELPIPVAEPILPARTSTPVDQPSVSAKAFLLRMFPLGEDRVPLALAEDLVSTGWGNVGPMLLSESLDWRAFRQLVHDAYYSADSDYVRSGNSAGQLWRFIRGMRLGDLVLVTQWSRLHLAHVKGPATHDASAEAEHWAYQRPVEWLTGPDGVARDSASESLRRRLRSRVTCLDISDLADDVQHLVSRAHATARRPVT